jgi:hypothetical protein
MKLTAILILMLALGALYGAQQSTTPTKGLAVVLRAESVQHAFSLKDEVTLDFEILNEGPSAIGVYAHLGMGYQGGIILHVLDSNGAEIPSPTLEHDFLYPADVQDPKNYFELRPSQFFGSRQRFTISELVGKPGSYKLLAEYHCPVDTNSAKVKNFWGMEQKSVVSEQVSFDVR